MFQFYFVPLFIKSIPTNIIKATFSATKNGSKPIILDVTDSKSIEKAVVEVEDALKEKKMGLIGLINNAGYSLVQLILFVSFIYLF